MKKRVVLRSGTLHLDVERADMSLDELCGFASRRSRKRGFVFVSKVLGKHYPVRPSAMAQVHDRLAAKLAEVSGPAVLIAMAETATALGQGVYDSLLRRSGRDDILFLHTTRYRLRRPVALHFEECHSHATEHLLYAPAEADHERLFRQARTLILVDDEISTGRTLANLARAYREVNANLAAVQLCCLTDWMGLDCQSKIAARIALPTTFHSLLEGRFHFEENPLFDPGPIPDVTGNRSYKDEFLPAQSGRLGVGPAGRLANPSYVQALAEKTLVLGTGEFTYPPYLLARRLEEQGHDVQYQSTTRSPLLVDGDITSALEFIDNYHDDMANYLYNVQDRRYDRILIGYETAPLPASHDLPAMVKGTPIFFGARK